MGEIALRIANGARAQDIPIESAERTPIFDWGQLRRWGLKESLLPPGSIVLNRQPTLWESYKWYIVSGICLLLAQTSLIIGLLWQRATRRKAEADLALTYERLRGIVSSAMDAIIATDIERRIVLFNNAAEEMFGCSEQEALGAPIDRFIPQRFRSTHSAQMRSFGESAATTRVMGGLCAMRANGQEFPIDASISQVESAGTKLYTVIIRDITERLQAETAVKESEERFRLVANTAPVMIWTTGTDKLCNYVNKPWLDFTGRTLEQELGSGWAEGIHNEDVFNCLTTYTEAFDRREQFEMQYRLRRHDGEFRWVLDIGVPRFNADSTFAGYIGSCIDITERKRAEEALSTIGRRLIEAHEEERAWIGRELHDDINQRLALLAVELDQWSMDQSQSTFTEHLRHAQSRITEIAKDVQALSHRLHSSKLDYLGLAVAAKSFCGELSGQAKVEVQFSHSAVPSTMPKEVSLCMFRVLQEALQNAIKHSGVRLYYVNLHGTADRVELTVSDDGRGFDEQAGFTSQGLGLISMRERLQMVNGVLDIQTQPGAGTTISARVPLHAELQAKAG
jgi:PAS domain S-box-containing protein